MRLRLPNGSFRQREPRGHGPSTLGQGSRAQDTALECDALAHSRHAVPGTVGRAVHGLAFVGHRHEISGVR